MPGPYTRLELTGQVLDELQDSNADYFALLKVREFLNKGMGEWCERTRARRATFALDVLAEQAIVSLAGTTPPILEVLGVSLPIQPGVLQEHPLELWTLNDVMRYDADWRNRRGNPMAYVREDQGHQRIRLWPTPDTPLSTWARSDGRIVPDALFGMIGDFTGIGDVAFDALYGAGIPSRDRFGGLHVDAIVGATPMTADADTPYTASDVPFDAHDAIGSYAIARCLMMDGPLQSLERAQVYMAAFTAKVEESTSSTAQGFQAKPARIVRLAR